MEAGAIFAPSILVVMKDLHITDTTVGALQVSVFLFASAVGPLFLAPLSEKYGRVPIVHLGNLIFVLFSVGGGFAQTVCSITITMFHILTLQGCAILGMPLHSRPWWLRSFICPGWFCSRHMGSCSATQSLWTCYVRNVSHSEDYTTIHCAERSVFLGRYWVLYVEAGCPSDSRGVGQFGFPYASFLEYSFFQSIDILKGIASFILSVVGFIYLPESYAPKVLQTKLRKLQKITPSADLYTVLDLQEAPRGLGTLMTEFIRPSKL